MSREEKLALYWGWSGAYRFHKKQYALGFIYLCTLGICCIGWIIDIIEVKKQKPRSFSFDIMALDKYDLDKVAIPKKDYDFPDEKLISKGAKKVYRFKYPSEVVSLIPEPTNEYDKNAIMVCLNDYQIGYVPRRYTSVVNDIYKWKNVLEVSCTILGGEYKEVVNDHVYMEHNDIHGDVRIKYK